MDRKHIIITLLLMVLFMVAVTITGCEKGSATDGDDTTTTSTTTTPTTSTASTTSTPTSELSAIVIDSGLGTINPSASTDVVATAYNESGGTVSGVALKFVVDNPALASVGSSATTGSDGTATVLFQARTKTGTSAITASSGSVTSSPLSITIQNAVVVGNPGTFTLSLNPSKVLAKGKSTVTAEVRDSSGTLVAAGTNVSFEVADENFGTVSPLSSTTNAVGVATTTFTAKSQPGLVKINVTATNITNGQTEIEVLGSDPAAIRFVSTERNTIAVQETGGIETTGIQFEVTDGNNDPVQGQNVSLTLIGPEGGEYIDESDATPETLDVSTDENGIAKVTLHSGKVAGPVTIQASITVGGSVISVRSPIVSIGGGVASDKRFDAASTVLNLPGIRFKNRQTELTGYLADRFGNFNILEGTTVSFSPELGLASFSNDITEATVNAQGAATITLRTQNEPEDVQPLAWETALQAAIDGRYSTTFAADGGHPRDGLCSVLLYTRGEEHFDDSDADGVYDAGETFVDTFDDPFVDFNDDGTYIRANPADPEELYIESDRANNPGWSGTNGSWDSEKQIFLNFPILITGQPIIRFDVNSVTINNSGSQTILVLVCDQNMNIPTGGTTITISSTVGKLSGNTSVTVPDTNALFDLNAIQGAIEYSVTLSDSDPTKTKREVGNITAKVVWEGLSFESTIGAVVDGP